MNRQRKKKRGRPVTVVTDDAVELARNLLAQGALKSTIKNELRRGKPCSHQALEMIISRAREGLAAETSGSRKQMRVTALQRYEAIIADPKTSARDKIRAQDSLCKLFGLQVHTSRVVHTGTGEGGAIKTENTTTVNLKQVPTKDLQAAHAALQRLREAAQSGGNN